MDQTLLLVVMFFTAAVVGLALLLLKQNARLKEIEHDLSLRLSVVESDLLIAGAAQGGGGDVEQVAAEVAVLRGLVRKVLGDEAVSLMPETAPRVVATGDLLSDVREAIRSDRIDFYLQPIVSLPQRKPSHAECYTRLRRTDGSAITPESFLPIAENEGLITTVDNYLLFRCIQHLRRPEVKRESGCFFVNVSLNSLRDPEFAGSLFEFLKGNHEIANRIVFELAPEHLFSTSDKKIEAALARLIGLGARTAVLNPLPKDLELSWLQGRRVKFIKYNARVLAQLLEDGQINWRQMKDLIDPIAIDIVLEKVESERDIAEVIDYKPDFAQGYLFSPPRKV